MVVAAVAAINFIAAFLQASTGFGYALTAMSLMPLFMPMAVCSAVSAATVVCIAVHMVMMLRHHLRASTIALPVAFCLASINVGLLLLDRLDEMTLRVVLACLLLVVTALLFTIRRGVIDLRGSRGAAVVVGLITGISTGMFNIVGPFLLVYYMSVCDDTMHLKASLEASFLAAGIWSAANHIFVYGNLNAETWPLAAASCAAAAAANVLGLRLYKRVDRAMIARIAYGVLPVMAAALIWNGLSR